jgi:hypothetical protein
VGQDENVRLWTICQTCEGHRKRDVGFPFPHFIGQQHSGLALPIQAMAQTAGAVVLIQKFLFVPRAEGLTSAGKVDV